MEKQRVEGQNGEACPAVPFSPAAEDVRAQLDHLLRSPHFKNSKRCQSLLTFVVERALAGEGDQLKERTIGVRAFGRDPAYDTNQDAVVRNVAIEVRKRLAQFYLEGGHDGGVRIELPPGSYVPEFRVDPPAIKQADPASPAAAPVKRHRRRRWILAGFAILVLGTAAAIAFRQTRPTAFDRFWAPVLEGKSVVQICIGQPAELYSFQGARKGELDRFFSNLDVGDARDGQAISRSEVAPVAGRYLWRRDAFCMASLAGMLGARGKPFRLRNDSDAPYSELRGSPLIMIGAFDWRRQIRLTTRRFGFGQARVDGVDYKYVRDSQKPEDLRWKFPLAYATQEATGYDDYGIITRELMSNSEKPVISAVGATDYSTLAAGEFLVNPSYVADALRNAPANWHAKNIQVVIRTRIIQGVPGPPSAVATHFW